MSTQRELQKEKTTLNMLEAALEEFANNGFSQTRVNNIAIRAGVAKGLINSRFGTKDELFIQIVENLFDKYVTQIEEYSDIKSILINIVLIIKNMITNPTADNRLIIRIIRDEDFPPKLFDVVKKRFEKSSLYEIIKQETFDGVLINKPPFELIQTFYKAVVGITLSYIKADLAIPNESEYLKIVIVNERKKESDTGFEIKNNSNNIDVLVDDSEDYQKIAYESLFNDYSSIYYVNLSKNLIKTIKTSDAYKSIIPENGIFTEEMKKYANCVALEYREAWDNLSYIDYIKQFLKDDDHREYVYSIDPLSNKWYESGNVWRRCIFRVIARENSDVKCFVMSFNYIDIDTAKQYELNNKISQQKKVLESQSILLEQALQRAEKANKAKTSFLTNLSHDIRTPMNAIMGFTSLALENITDTQKVQEFLDKAVISGKHLLSLINDVLDMSRIESGHLQLEESACNLCEIFKDVYTIINGQAEAKQQKFILDINSIINPNIICDKLRLNQVLINLASNAVKYTPVGGNIYLITRQISQNEQTASFEIHIKDNGIGMSQDFIEKIYQPFEREANSTMSGISGFGLGMAITKNIIDMMGGSMQITSKQGSGTEVIIYLTLKLDKKRKAEDLPDIVLRNNLYGKNILIVDDNDFNREIATELLKSKGFIVDIAENGQIAVDKIQKLLPKKYSAVLMDIQMPVMDGYEATKEIRKMKGLGINDLPIIAMTANAFTEDKIAALEVGMNAHLVKPIVLNDLYKVLNEFIKS